ncbi:UNVERIFIED_CONTAM: hypothetical protein PYX00_010455 [Menopon gallinae]|uniref:Uncharacterized protein n=1 Tax=Menopon gallinae TaxID=328185 RepID=A0AAW2HFD1_9NEOP
MFNRSVNIVRKCCPCHGALTVTRGVRRRLPPDPALAEEIPVVEYAKKKPKENILYVWGLGEHGALGHYHQKRALMKGKSDIRFRTYNRPLRLHFGEHHSVVHVAAGYGFSLFSIKNSGPSKVYGTGLNTDSQLGFQGGKKNTPMGILIAPVPVKIPFNETNKTKIIGLAAGRAHSVVVTDNEGIFTFGNNSYGQCGRTIFEDEDYGGSHVVHNIKNLDGLKIQSAECGQDHTLLLMEDGSVYSCGWGADGQTGLGHMSNVERFTKVKGEIEGEKIVKISSKADCVLALNDKGEVFGWGNTEYCQIFDEGGQYQQVNTPVHLKKCQGFGKIIDVAAAGSLCMMLNEAGEVFTWGFGILGRGPVANISWKPEIIPSTIFGKTVFEPDMRVTSIHCGLNHCAAITNKGDLYTWGKNRGYCLGLGIKTDQFFPLRVAIGNVCKTLSMGVDHTIALCGTI